MRITRLVLAEMLGRPVSFLLCLAVVVVATVLFIAGPAILHGYAADTQRQLTQLQQETDTALGAMQTETDVILKEMDTATKRIMRDMGVNLRIVHRDTRFGDLYTDYAAVDFPEEYVERLATASHVQSIVHLVATLQEKIKWQGRSVLLIGMLPMLTASQKNAEMKHMARDVAEGTVVVGHELANGLAAEQLAQGDANGNGQLDAGDQLEILGTTFRVAEVRPEEGGIEDVQLVLHLHDAQRLIDKPGRIHQIMALSCKCHGSRLSEVRRELEGILPDTKVTEHLSRATAREQQRDLVELKRAEQLSVLKENRQQQMETLKVNRVRGENLLAGMVDVMLPLVVLVAAAVVGLMSWWNVRERQAEIGLLRALGKRTSQLAALFLLKAIAIGLLGGLIACVVVLAGYGLLASSSVVAGGTPAAAFRPLGAWLVAALCGAPLVTTLASYLPMLLAVSQDPARILTEA